MTKTGGRHAGLDAVARIGKAIDHPLRIRALAVLRGRELCVCELIDLFGLAPSTVSKHMAIIADAELVTRRRDGKWTYYSLAENPGPSISRAIEAVLTLVEADPVVADDRRRVEDSSCAVED